MTRAAKGLPELVGRSSEIVAIRQAIDMLESGHGRPIMFSGEPGIGKSSLARFAAATATARSIPVFFGFSWEAGGAPAYWPWTQLLGSLVNELEPADELVAGIGQLLPGTDEATDGPALQPNQARFRLLESVRRLLEEVSRERPMLLIFEDLHAADSDSLNLLHHVCRHVAGMPILVIGTFREQEARALAANESLWLTCRDAQVYSLDKLSEPDIRAYLEAYREEAPAAAEVKRMFAVTEGNPLFLTELVDLLAHREPGNIRLPQNVSQVIRQQIDLLPEGTASLLSRAAVLGREFSLSSLAALAHMTLDDVQAGLSIAVESGLMRQTPSGSYRFYHGLHRDVLYQSIDESERPLLHHRVSRHLATLIDEGDEDRWTEVAEHLKAAGSDHREAAIDAWRNAARRASQRLAFDDAVESLSKALAAFGEGPKSAPAERFELLLECAEASLLTGDTETGYEHCGAAFRIARTLADPVRMSRAALTWGGTIVVARVDSDLIAALEESLAALPEDDVALRAQVQARLAGAMQPARDPSVPMAMAREAIQLARTTGDEDVLYSVLRSAIAALMDFAPPDERLPLNEEFAALAEARGDVPGQFRATLRLMIDACEAADRGRMDSSIDECHRLAERIALPHYRWRAASARAMQATLDGDFPRAIKLLKAAGNQAGQYDDIEAMVTLPLQRFTILIEWDSDQHDSLADIEASLQQAYTSGVPAAEEYVTPFLVSYSGSADAARRLLANRQLVERTFAGGDRYSLCRVAEMAAMAGDAEVASGTVDALLPFSDGCATPGLLGSSCTGPTAWSIGVAAASLGRHEFAMEYLQKALNIAESMRAPPWIARIHKSIAETAAAIGDDEIARLHAATAEKMMTVLGLRRSRAVPTDGAPHHDEKADFQLEQEGDFWRVTYRGESTLVRQSKGLGMLAMLIRKPDAEIHVLDLSGGATVVKQGGTGPAIDSKARAAYESRIRELREELEEAEEFGDPARADSAREEIDAISRELSRAYGLGGAERKDGDDAERARVNVRRRLKDAIERISRQHSGAGRYLENTIKTGTYCRYTPM